MVDIAVDPIDGTTLTALGRGNALAVIAVSERGTMFDPGPCVYMEKVAVGPEAAGSIDITASATENLHAVAKAKGESVRDVTAVILDRHRHARAHRRGARRPAPASGSSPTATSPAPSPPLGPAPAPTSSSASAARRRASIAAAALKCMGGEIQGRLWPRDDDERDAGRATPATTSHAVLTTDDLVAGDNCFFAATGITDGELLKGVRYEPARRHTQSLVMRSRSGTVRLVDARHRLDKLQAFASVNYD